MAAASLGPRQAAVLAHLEEHPGLTAGELARVFGLAGSLHKLLYRLERAARVVPVTAWDPGQGRIAARWYVAPEGTVPPAPPPASPAQARRRRERDRLAQRARRARGRGLAVVPGMEPPSLKDFQGAVPDLPGAACKGEDPNLFFPLDGERVIHPRRARQAKAVCAGCPVRAECYAAAMANGEPWGVWAGVDFGERKTAGRKAS